MHMELQLTCLKPWKSPETWVTCLMMKMQNWDNNEILIKIWWKKECNLEKPVAENVIQHLTFSNIIRESVESLKELKKSNIYFFVVTVYNSLDFLIKL